MRTGAEDRLEALDREIRDLVAHEGYTPRVHALIAELETLALAWVEDAERRYSERLQAQEGQA